MDLYLFIVIILFVLAASDLMVGVSNDAVNFLNSAIGSKVAPRNIIMIVASIGILVGTTFSSGLMEVARKGIFNPETFYFNDVMIIFLAVMITDVMLLDLFNTFGLPTSTTVSVVFELLGSSVAIAIIKVINNSESFSDLYNYINTSKATEIIVGILLSVLISFTTGAILQFITRWFFTFNYEEKFKKYGFIWASIALTGITLFIALKGAKGASFLSDGTILWIKSNTFLISIFSFVFWSGVFAYVINKTNFNVLKPIVLLGTFALALAFAANDLVNFIGVPLAGLSSYQASLNVEDVSSMLMTNLTEKVQSNTWILLVSGLIMIYTLWKSKKAQSVTKTEVNLGRQSEGHERFKGSALSRGIVNISSIFLNGLNKILPNEIRRKIDKSFSQENYQPALGYDGKVPAFDLIRAANNLMIASILISIATSLKLPLSTTYVTFMVAMGTSLADRAWGKESAVQRVSGVITVIGGWFLTAFTAFTVAGIFAVLMYFLDMPAIIFLVALAALFILRTAGIHKKRFSEEEKQD